MSALILPGQFIYNPIPRTGEEEINLLLRTIPEIKEWDGLIHPDGQERMFTIVRNPFELVKIWFDLNPSWTDFNDFCEHYVHSHFEQNGKLFWTILEDRDVMVLKYEELPDCLEELLIDNFDIHLQIPELKTTEYRDAYSPETIAIVEKRFAEELATHRYQF